MHACLYLDLTFALAGHPQTKRHGSAHTLLSAELVAKHLTQNGIFVHDGEEYIDEEHRQLNDNVFRHLIGKGITGGLRYYMRKNKKTFSDVIDTVFHVPLTSTYEFAVEDVPEIYARIVSDPSFVDFKWNGMTFDREIVSVSGLDFCLNHVASDWCSPYRYLSSSSWQLATPAIARIWSPSSHRGGAH